jgi:Dolichyl-phosphate-mannose-protein mannosyltransferase
MPRILHCAAAAGLLVILFFWAGGAALHESATVDEVAHVGAGLSYLQCLDLRLNPEHPPLAKALAAVPLAIRGAHADYSTAAWKLSADFFTAYGAQWIFGDAVLGRWNDWKSTLMWARFPMLILTLLLGWIVYHYGARLGGPWGGLLCLTGYVTTPAFLVFGSLVITDLPVTLFSLITLWQLGAIWSVPSSRSALLFGFALAASLLSKFTGLLIIPVIIVLFVQTRFWPTAAQPTNKDERKAWRKARFRCVLRGVLWAALVVYVVYFILSWNQPDDALNRVGSGPWASLIRRPLMPLWLYCRGVLLMLIMGSRTTFLFGHVYPHGVPYYFPVVFLLKSTLGFLLLLFLAAVVSILSRKRGASAIPEKVRPHWRVLMIGFFVFLVVCILSQLDISIRHFMVPVVLLILMLAPLPRMIGALPQRSFLRAATIALALSCFIPIFRAYPYFFPFINSLAFGHPAYYLINDSNVTWNEGLPEVERFVRQQHLGEIALDWASLSDPALVVPEARIWDCQAPEDRDAGRWVAVTSVSILENHNCGYLQHYPHRQLGGGAFYVFKLPTPIPPAGTPDGPPAAAERRLMWGMPVNLRDWSVNVERHPERLPVEMQALIKKFQRQSQQQTGNKGGK